MLTKPLPLTAAFPTGSAFRSPYFTRPSAPQGERTGLSERARCPLPLRTKLHFFHAFSEKLETQRALICVQGHLKFGCGPSGVQGSQITANLQSLHGLKCPFPQLLNLAKKKRVLTLFGQSTLLISACETIYIWTSAAGQPSLFHLRT